jgi:octaprenyl-diphosphate synthase
MTFDDIISDISMLLNLFEQHFGDLLESDLPIINDVISHLKNTNGKRFRPSAMLLIAKTFYTNNSITLPQNSKKLNQILDYAAMIELIHTASLIHDDVVDNAMTRRNISSVNALWNNRVSILVGDYLFSHSFQPALKSNDFFFFNVVANTTTEMSRGELIAIQTSNTLECSESQYIDIISAKTASLISTACLLVATASTDNKQVIDSFTAFGKNLGIAFQMTDDIFDYSSNQNTIGKPIGNDIREKKITLPLIYSLSTTSENKKTEILTKIANPEITQEDIDSIIAFAIDNGGIDYTIAKAKAYIDSAISAIVNIPDSKEKQHLINFANYIITRNK